MQIFIEYHTSSSSAVLMWYDRPGDKCRNMWPHSCVGTRIMTEIDIKPSNNEWGVSLSYIADENKSHVSEEGLLCSAHTHKRSLIGQVRCWIKCNIKYDRLNLVLSVNGYNDFAMLVTVLRKFRQLNLRTSSGYCLKLQNITQTQIFRLVDWRLNTSLNYFENNKSFSMLQV